MLRRLEIENYGLIARAGVEFSPGATIFTGETGSGKTMLLGALDFALGARAGADIVGRAARKAAVTISFDPDEALRARLAADGFELDAGEDATVAREMSEAGRSNVRVNGRPATAGYVRELAETIAEIVGQHEARHLVSPAYHLELLDRFAGDEALKLRESTAQAHRKFEQAAASLERLTGDDRDARRRYEEASFVAGEIESARVDPAEQEPLASRRAYLDNVERIATALGAAVNALTQEEPAALEIVAASLASVGRFGDELQALAERAAALQSEVGELTSEIARALEATEFDPGELETINARLAQLERLARLYGGSLEEVVERARAARETIAQFENRDELLAQARGDAADAQRDLARLASVLSKLRHKAAETLAKRVLGEFGEIALRSGRFEIALEPTEKIGPAGGDRIEFLFAANAGETPKPIARVASGGELSRVLLALVVSLAQSERTPAARIFDEIDAGIGGATAVAVGERIGELSRRGQVVCVTHLAQIATFADRHYVLDKHVRKGETTIGVRELEDSKQREAEIARMLSGETHDVALAHARALLERSRSAFKGSGGS
ncbi:MAG TPA: DNA repair protein RecN [Candidatus Cybelea sp.]|jgi:DNA repair protein RecN (Recombination protein N)|nr:DNA repair protein RecN [Candidatus Cybelea sp.]